MYRFYDLYDACMIRSVQRKMQHRQQEYIRKGEEKLLALQVVAPPANALATNPRLQPGVRVLGGGPEVVIPTTEEMMRFVTVDPGALTSIRELESLARQVADEKVAIADQTYALVDSVVKRLDADLEAMEKTLQSTGEFQVAGVARPDDLAAVQVTSGSDWILAKVISHDPSTGFYKLSDEDVESNKSKSPGIQFQPVWIASVTAWFLTILRLANLLQYSIYPSPKLLFWAQSRS